MLIWNGGSWTYGDRGFLVALSALPPDLTTSDLAKIADVFGLCFDYKWKSLPLAGGMRTLALVILVAPKKEVWGR